MSLMYAILQFPPIKTFHTERKFFKTQKDLKGNSVSLKNKYLQSLRKLLKQNRAQNSSFSKFIEVEKTVEEIVQLRCLQKSLQPV